MKALVILVWACAAFYFVVRWGDKFTPVNIIEDGIIYLALGFLAGRYTGWKGPDPLNQFDIPEE
jgi:hypothetical protein